MNNRVVAVISFIIFFFATLAASNSNEMTALFMVLPVILYWAYKLIKNEKKSAKIDATPDQLLKWNELLAKGAITQEEYDKAKRDLLG